MKANFKLIFTAVCFISAMPTMAQKINISGKIQDTQKAPVFAANIYLKKALEKGSTSGLDGTFTFNIDKNNLQDTLVISFIGYEHKEIPLRQIDLNKEIFIILKEDQTVLSEITIKANPSLSREFSIQKVSRLEIYSSPTAAGDALKMITTLPASTNTSESANPELRGSSGNMSRIVLNGVPLYNPVRNTQISGMGNFSLLNTELIGEQLVYASNPPLTYGNSTAGLVEIETTKQLKNNQTQIAASLANLGLLHSQQINDKSFIQVYGNYQFSKPYIYINKKNIDDLDRFTSKDAGINFHLENSKGLIFNIYSYFIDEKYLAQDQMYNYYGDLSAKKRRNFNILNIKYKTAKTILSYSNGTNFSVTNYKFGNIHSKQWERQYYSNIDVKYFANESLFLQTGLSHDYSNMDFSNQFPHYYYAISPNDSSYVFDNKIDNHNLELFLYGRWEILSNLTLGSGIRKNIPVKDQHNSFSFQSSLRYAINNKHYLLLSGGKYNGFSIPTYYIQEFTPITSKQLSFEYKYSAEEIQLGTSFYLKNEKYTEYFTDMGDSKLINKKIRGIELFGEKSINKFIFSGSYTYLFSQINRDGKWYKSQNKMNYMIKLSGVYSNSKYGTIGLSFITRPGHYYTPVTSSIKNPDINIYEPVMGEFNSAQHNRYKILNLNYNKVLNFKNSHIIFFVSINNILNNKNILTEIYNNDYSAIERYQYYQKRLFYGGVQVNF